MDAMKSLETLDTKSVLDSTMKMELLKAWTFDLHKQISDDGIEPTDAIESLSRARDALRVAKHFILSDSVSGSINDIVYHRLVTEVMDLLNGVNLCLEAMRKAKD